MPRLPRVYIENILYYVTSKGGHNQDIFKDPADYKEYIALIDKYKWQYGFKLFSYVLLPSHLHMLIELKNNIGVSNIMHDINSLYTKIFNSRYNRKGHLFQERFKASFADKETCLLPLVRNIHLNPKRLGFVVEPKDYPYSSHFKFLDPEKRTYPDMRGEIEEIFGLLNGREGVFDDYVKNVDPRGIDEFKKKLQKRRILGPKQFVSRIRKTMEEATKRQERASLPKRIIMTYLLLGGALILITAVSVGYFYKKSAILSTEYDKTLLLYKKTLEMLEREKKEALMTEKGGDVEDYAWKIRLAEKALKEVREERSEAIAKKELEGYAWSIILTQTGGPAVSFSNLDTIFFKNDSMNSSNLSQKGFSDSAYSKMELENGDIDWETIQTNNEGETASWRGEWNGKVMKGVLSRKSYEGIVRDFSFISTSGRIKR